MIWPVICNVVAHEKSGFSARRRQRHKGKGGEEVLERRERPQIKVGQGMIVQSSA